MKVVIFCHLFNWSCDFSDNYGFVTFKYKNDAYEAIERGNDNPGYPKVDLCFGGRRNFCKEKYSDLGEFLRLQRPRQLVPLSVGPQTTCTLASEPS